MYTEFKEASGDGPYASSLCNSEAWEKLVLSRLDFLLRPGLRRLFGSFYFRKLLYSLEAVSSGRLLMIV